MSKYKSSKGFMAYTEGTNSNTKFEGTSLIKTVAQFKKPTQIADGTSRQKL
jgi:hypothetical protein